MQSPPTPRRVLPVLVLAPFLGTSPWFAVNAVMPDLQRDFGWPAASLGTLTSAAQFGFITGALVFVLLALAASWFPRGLGGAMGLLIAGLLLGSAAPHTPRALSAG